MSVASKLDLTLLSPTASDYDIEQLVADAITNQIYAVCVSPTKVSKAVSLSSKADLKVASVVGFPTGNHSTDVKLFEMQEAIRHGAHEIDMVANLSYIENREWSLFQSELEQMLTSAETHGVILKVILESALWSYDLLAEASRKSSEVGVHYIKTSTGYSNSGGATLDAVSIMLDNAGDSKVKASGGIRTLENAKSYLLLGVDRIGASSVGVLSSEPSLVDSNSY